VPGNHITVELALPNLIVERQVEQGQTVTVEVRFRCQERRCPRCGRLTGHVHQYHDQLKQHKSLWGKRILLPLRKGRFRCVGCGQVFMESEEVCGWHRRCTKALREYVAQESLTRTVKAVARREGVSEALVRRAFREMAHRALHRWWQDVRTRGPDQFLGLRHILTHWREEILNCFYFPVTNGFAEGKSNRIKVIIPSGYGYRNQWLWLSQPGESGSPDPDDQPLSQLCCGAVLIPHFLT